MMRLRKSGFLRTVVGAAALLFAAALAQAQFQGGYGNGSMAPPPPQKHASTRTLTGDVLNQNDAPLASAVVYLKDTQTLAVRTYITGKDGGYSFNGLDPNRDYEVRAEYKGNNSPRRTLSSFDSRMNPNINLKIDVKTK